jgi:pyruvate,orthophosphate dikinase
MRELLGGKGANVAEMTRVLGEDRVPAGFTISTAACVAYMRSGEVPPSLAREVQVAMQRLKEVAGKRFGDPDNPLLVSVRSGARVSMPGMLDTVLNLGLNDETVKGLAKISNDERFAWDSYRRLLTMFATVVRRMPAASFEQKLSQAKTEAGVKLDNQLPPSVLQELVDDFKALFAEPFPQDPRAQLNEAIKAVFDSWSGERAVQYRRIHQIPDSWGTAVTVQQMVFGNLGEDSGTGVAFSRDEVTGVAQPSGDFLTNAQGEDVVGGTRNTQELAMLAETFPEAHTQLLSVLGKLERHYKDMQDVEFTIERGKLYLLQTRSAKRPAQAAVRFALDSVTEGLLTKKEALTTIDATRLDSLLHPSFDPEFKYDVLARGVAASPGAAKGVVVFSAAEAVEEAGQGQSVILARPFTEADDVAGFYAARGILTSEGGKASHAALVARGMGRPCVCGAASLAIDPEQRTITVEGQVIKAGNIVAIDGSIGTVTLDDVPLVEPAITAELRQVLQWADELRRLQVRANADTPTDARRARELGAQGIGLCRTEHMFMAADRQPKMRQVILAETPQERRAALDELLDLQREDFTAIFAVMAGQPITVRLLDPPLHEFLPPSASVQAEVERARHERRVDELADLEHLLDRVHTLSEVNPMLGTRGCRLAILYPEIYEMQVKAIMQAACSVRDKSSAPHIEVMIPLVAYPQELELMRELVVNTAREQGMQEGEDYTVGTMIELPRACISAGKIAPLADFFSFGTNDLTQTTLGFSRDDVEAGFLSRYLDLKIIEVSPFETLDRGGVGALVELGCKEGRKAKPTLTLGVCGEQGGDPQSINFFEQVGLDYVSCSPYRVPIARLAAAQAAITSDDGD